MAKADIVKTDTTKTDTTKTDTTKTDAIKTDAIKTDPAKFDATKVDTAKADAVKADTAKADMTKIDFDSMSIEELATLRDTASAKLLEKVAARQVELEAEIERLSQYGKPSKKAVATAPVAKAKKGPGKADEVALSAGIDGSVAEAA